MSVSIGSTNLALSLKGSLQNTLTDSRVVSYAFDSGALGVTLTNGSSGALKANREWSSIGRTLGASASETISVYNFNGIDIGGGAGNDAMGVALALASLVLLIINVASDSADRIVVGNEGSSAEFSNLFGGTSGATATLYPGDVFMVLQANATAIAIDSTTNHKLKIASPGTGAKYSVHLLGRQ